MKYYKVPIHDGVLDINYEVMKSGFFLDESTAVVCLLVVGIERDGWEEITEKEFNVIKRSFQVEEVNETEQELIMQQLADLELQNLEAQQERQILAQQISDLEIAILEGGVSNV